MTDTLVKQAVLSWTTFDSIGGLMNSQSIELLDFNVAGQHSNMEATP